MKIKALLEGAVHFSGYKSDHRDVQEKLDMLAILKDQYVLSYI